MEDVNPFQFVIIFVYVYESKVEGSIILGALHPTQERNVTEEMKKKSSDINT